MLVKNVSNVNFTNAVTANRENTFGTSPIRKIAKTPIATISFDTANTKSVATTPMTPKTLHDKKNDLKDLHMDMKSINTAVTNNLDLEKLGKMVKSMSTDETTQAVLAQSPFDSKNDFLVMVNTAPNDLKLNLVDKKLDVMAKEEKTVFAKPQTELVNGRKSSAYSINKTVDYRTNTTNVIKADVDDEYGFDSIISEQKTKTDKLGRLIRRETLEKSPVAGIFNAKYDFPNGKSRILSSAKVDKKTGNTVVQKDMRSSDMTHTQYRYEDDVDGNRIVDYKITDVNGNVLMKQSQTFEKISDNKFVSSRNDKVYDIELTPKSLDVTDRNKKEKFQIPLEGFIEGDQKKITNLLKTVPGDELKNLAKTTVKVKEIPNKLDSYCQTQIYRDDKGGMFTAGTLAVSDDLFVFLHELGHATDMDGKEVEAKFTDEGLVADIKNSINGDEKFMKTYNEERTNFLKEFPEAQRNYIDYFIAEEAVPGQKDRGRKETIAETNAMLNTYNTVDELAIRSQYLQQHFPKTIAYLSTKLTAEN